MQKAYAGERPPPRLASVKGPECRGGLLENRWERVTYNMRACFSCPPDGTSQSKHLTRLTRNRAAAQQSQNQKHRHDTTGGGGAEILKQSQ